MKRYAKLTPLQLDELKNMIHDSKKCNEVKRAQIIIMLNEEKSVKEIVSLTGYGRSQIFQIRKNYYLKGIKAIEEPPRKSKALLTKGQREELLETLKTKAPNECDSYYKSDYWTSSIVANYIERKYNVRYKSKTSIYVIFKQAKFSYHKPERIHHKRDEKEVEMWRTSIEPQIAQAWDNKNTVILTEDEMVLSTQTTIQKIWIPQGEYPKIEVSNKKENRSIYGFLNIKTGQEHAFKKDRQNMYITRDVLKKLREIYPVQNILLLWDGPGWHRGSEVQKFIKEDKNIKTIYFPKYSPEENPQEHVWKEGRNKITHNKFIEDIDKATDEFVDYLNKTKFSYSLLGFKSEVKM